MNRPLKDDRSDLKVLREVLSGAIDRNLALETRLAETVKTESELSFEAAALTLVEALRKAETAMEDEAEGQSRFCVSEFEVSLKGFIRRKEGAFVLQLPRKEAVNPPELLSTVRINVAKVPASSPSASDSFVRALEGVQGSFGAWDNAIGREEAQTVAAIATHILSTRAEWRQTDWISLTKPLSDSVDRFIAALKIKSPSLLPAELAKAASNLRNLLQVVAGFESRAPGNLAQFALLIERIGEELRSY